MFAVLVLAVLLCLSCSVFAATAEDCGENKEYKCETVCYKTCDDLHILVSCVPDCDEGCYCVDGFVFENRNSTKCVPRETCKTYCDSTKLLYYNDEFICECQGSDYSTCKKCTPGCSCQQGYNKNDQGVCVENLVVS